MGFRGCGTCALQYDLLWNTAVLVLVAAWIYVSRAPMGPTLRGCAFLVIIPQVCKSRLHLPHRKVFDEVFRVPLVACISTLLNSGIGGSEPWAPG